jgi:hypothetical protein
MSAFTSGNKAPTLMKQNANRVGNSSVREASHDKGVTAITNPKGSLFQPKGSQGAPAYMKATDNTSVGATGGNKQKVMVNRPAEYYCGTIKNDGYMNSDRNNFLK